ncbi:hypothetical protein ACRALDRAFT_209826 [Sodiomyces alcalophilus JCM 7366]|uniref:uncharacterized protein n=1 Tax=Sodiomyces alcalophilus JCM 7366 TaxID=591952 RepID=UPI0039B6E448
MPETCCWLRSVGEMERKREDVGDEEVWTGIQKLNGLYEEWKRKKESKRQKQKDELFLLFVGCVAVVTMMQLMWSTFCAALPYLHIPSEAGFESHLMFFLTGNPFHKRHGNQASGVILGE